MIEDKAIDLGDGEIESEGECKLEGASFAAASCELSEWKLLGRLSRLCQEYELPSGIIGCLLEHYSDLPYHNLAHAISVAEEAESIAQRMQTYGAILDSRALVLAALFHDLGYERDYRSEGYESAEALAAEFAQRWLLRNEESEETASTVAEIILYTHAMSATHSRLEGLILRAADLALLGGEYEAFRESTWKLFREQQGSGAEEERIADWFVKGLPFLSLYTKSEISLTPEGTDRNGASVYHRNLVANVLRFFDEECEGLSASLVVGSPSYAAEILQRQGAPLIYVPLTAVAANDHLEGVLVLPPLRSQPPLPEGRIQRGFVSAFVGNEGLGLERYVEELSYQERL